MKQYSNLASVYDLLNDEYDYNKYADFLDSEIKSNASVLIPVITLICPPYPFDAVDTA